MNIRKAFLDFFQSREHTLHSSMPLVPNDDSLLFVNAGMVKFKDIFTGKVPTSDTNATSCQLCLRAGGKHNDLENVGYTRRHHTLFEMLGNFSFKGYFKEGAIDYAYEFITETLKLPKDKLWVTVHESDDEAYALWQKYFAVERIKKLGDKDNFWQMGDTGPCGPCSEIFYDQGEEDFHSSEDYLGGDGDRFLEIWNLVFMQYEQFKDGTRKELAQKCIDTGMGLERVQAILEGVTSNFDSSLFMPILNDIAGIVGKPYEYESGASYRVIADHIRSAVLLISDGVLFEKEGRGYVLRRIVRRAVRHGFLLGLKKPFMTSLVDRVIATFDGAYPSLEAKSEYIKEHIHTEEERFYQTIVNGMDLFKQELQKTKDTFSGEVAFKLYDTYGFPFDLTEDMLREQNIPIDTDAYEMLMNKQKEMARSHWKGSGDTGKQENFKTIIDEFGLNEFVGYENTSFDSKTLALFDENFEKTRSEEVV